MQHDHHLFISYAHIDDRPLTPGQQGWITRFHATLQALLSMRLGREAKIWRDEKLQGNDIFSDEIVARFKRSDLLVSIVSSRYLNSEWCTREAREFCAAAERDGGLVVDNKARVFKVIKTPVDGEEPLPAVMKEQLGYEFFVLQDGAPLELDPAYGQEYAQVYNQKVAKLAWDIKLMLASLQTRAPTAPAAATPAAPAKPAIYLAECSFDRKPARELIEGELRRLGYRVLPEQRLPPDEADYVAAVQAQLAGCALAVHLIGEAYGAVPDGPSAKSTAQHQNELAAARCKAGGLTRLIWLPAGTGSAQPQQQAFIAALHQDAQAQYGADLITGDLEQLKAAIHAALKKIEQPPPRATPAGAAEGAAAGAGTAKLVYLLCDEKDLKATVPLRRWCKQAGLEVERPVFEGDAAQLRKAHQQMLADCDGLILFYGAGDAGWKRSIDGELRKMAGWREGRPLLARCLYLAEPRSADKDDLIDMEEPGLVDGFAGFDEAAMAGFLRAMNAADQPA